MRTIPVRRLLRNHKEVEKLLSEDDEPVVVISHSQPLFAVINMKMFQSLLIRRSYKSKKNSKEQSSLTLEEEFSRLRKAFLSYNLQKRTKPEKK